MSQNEMKRAADYRKSIESILAEVPILQAKAKSMMDGGIQSRHAIRAALEQVHDLLPADAPERGQIRLIIDAPQRFPASLQQGPGKVIADAIQPAVDAARLAAFIAGILTGVRMTSATVPAPAPLTPEQEAARQAAEAEFDDMPPDILPPKAANPEHAPRVAPPRGGWVN